MYGRSPAGDYALPKTLEILDRNGLKGVFFVEPLFAARFGVEHLATIVDLIRAGGTTFSCIFTRNGRAAAAASRRQPQAPASGLLHAGRADHPDPQGARPDGPGGCHPIAFRAGSLPPAPIPSAPSRPAGWGWISASTR
jgi:hypothetical protein